MQVYSTDSANLIDLLLQDNVGALCLVCCLWPFIFVVYGHVYLWPFILVVYVHVFNYLCVIGLDYVTTSDLQLDDFGVNLRGMAHATGTIFIPAESL